MILLSHVSDDKVTLYHFEPQIMWFVLHFVCNVSTSKINLSVRNLHLSFGLVQTSERNDEFMKPLCCNTAKAITQLVLDTRRSG
mmetsp:Transcript_46596/g.97512  ORF Transcript_46596/g.97512 Transcript_46596/m.97512 type:complete len:84 (-) Transcript_46596:180-431(-)